ncbi:hypothetical protein NWF32_15095 [Pseudomonas qingdaonensis]|nr:hypothetical protein [Pseudomonas qingdaonensis]
MIISMAGGLFGFTVLTLAIPLLLCEAGSAMRRVLRYLGLQRQPVVPVISTRGLNVTD